MDGRFGAASAEWVLLWTSVVKRKLSQKAKLSIYHNLHYDPHLWKMQAAGMSFLHMSAGLSDRVRSLIIRGELRVETLLLRF